MAKPNVLNLLSISGYNNENLKTFDIKFPVFWSQNIGLNYFLLLFLIQQRRLTAHINGIALIESYVWGGRTNWYLMELSFLQLPRISFIFLCDFS